MCGPGVNRCLKNGYTQLSHTSDFKNFILTYIKKIYASRRVSPFSMYILLTIIMRAVPPACTPAFLFQVEIQNKLKDAFNVIEILSGIIGDTSKMSENEESPKRARSRSVDVKDVKFNYIHYDPELHWCRMCDVFPKTAKDLLIHLHTKEHRDMMQDDEIPWHKLPAEPEFPYVEGASKKRLPIKGNDNV